ncbi:MAG: Maf family protein [Erysipelotrichaceae bacterium]|nr:Maf family protein [Erysipelotrichaceae bacterium]
MNKIILASQSPRRKELLNMLGIPFDVIVADIDEQIDYRNNLVEEIKKLSYQKANAVFENHQDNIVIGSDTIVYINNEVLGKPKTMENAKEMLHKLSNKTHQVVTAVTIMSKEKTDTFASITDVTFYELTDKEINDYVESTEPLDKAGAYAIQGKGCEFVKAINGDYYTVVGLPIAEVLRHLRTFKADIV